MLRMSRLSQLMPILLFFLLAAVSSQARNAGPTDERSAEQRQNTAFYGGDEVSNSRQNAITHAVEIVSPAVVGVNASQLQRRNMDPWFRMFYGDQYSLMPVLGSGFIISADGYILTNDHVAGNAESISITMTNREKIPAKLIGTDPVTDISLLKIEVDHDLPYIKLGNSDDVIVGEWSIAFGNPFGLMSSSAKATVTVGVVSATHVGLEESEGRVYRNMIQTDASINSGNSGGPLVNSLGEVIGINTVIVSPNQGGGSVGLGFAVPINRVKEVVRILREEGKVNREFNPGFRVQPVNEAIAQAYNLKRVEGVVVTQITARKGVAAQAGLEVADIILKANGEPVYSVSVLQDLILYSLKNENIELEVLRNNEKKIIDLKLD
ncbi:MAG: trypsin-like peptidase domain-containing protein [Bacteroidota bacterium]